MELRNIRMVSRISWCYFHHPRGEKKYTEDLMYYCWIVEEKYWTFLLEITLVGRKKDFQSRYGIQFLPSKGTLVVTFPHQLYDTLGRLIFHARFFILLHRGTYMPLRDKYTSWLEYSNIVTICTIYIQKIFEIKKHTRAHSLLLTLL